MTKPKNVRADTMAAAAARLGIPLDYVRFAKRRACEAFTNGRVDCGKLRDWLEANRALVESEAVHDKERAQVRLILARVALAEHELGTRRREYIRTADAVQTFRHVAATTRAVLQRKLETELPPKLAGLDALRIGEIMTATVDEVCSRLNGEQIYATTETTTEPCGMAGSHPHSMPTQHLEHLAPSLGADTKGAE